MLLAWLLLAAGAINIVILVLLVTFFVILKERLSKLAELIFMSQKSIPYTGAKRGPKPKQSIPHED